MRSIVVALLLLPLAGCLSDGPVPTQEEAPLPYGARPVPSDAQSASAESRVDPTGKDGALAEATGVQRDDWFVLPNDATTEGAIAAYKLEIPAGATIPAWYSDDVRRPVIEFMFLDEPDLEAWALVLVDLESGEVVSTLSGFRHEGSFGFGASAGTGAGHRAMGTGQHGDYLDLDDMEDGDRLGIVVAAKGEGAADLGIRFVAQDPWTDGFTWPAENRDEFIERTSNTVWLPEHTGSASGLTLDMFYDSEGFYLIPHAYRVVVGDMQVDELVPDGPVVQPANDLALQAKGDAGVGYTSTLVWSWTGLHAGSITYDLQARDAEPLGGTALLTPDPIVHSVLAMSIGDGEGPSEAALQTSYAGAPGLFSKLLILDHLSLGDSLENLLGVPIQDASAAHASPLRQDVVDRSRLVLEGPGGTRIYQGLFPENARNL